MLLGIVFAVDRFDPVVLEELLAQRHLFGLFELDLLGAALIQVAVVVVRGGQAGQPLQPRQPLGRDLKLFILACALLRGEVPLCGALGELEQICLRDQGSLLEGRCHQWAGSLRDYVDAWGRSFLRVKAL